MGQLVGFAKRIEIILKHGGGAHELLKKLISTNKVEDFFLQTFCCHSNALKNKR